MNFILKLLPTGEEVRKLWMEVWKYFLLAGLGALLLFIPALRAKLVSWAVSAWEFTIGSHVVSGRVIVVLGLLAVVGLVSIGRLVSYLCRPAFVRRFRVADYDGIMWRWSWKKLRVNYYSLVPLCPTCGTELRLTPEIGHGGVDDTRIFCTTCNVARRFSNVDDLRHHVQLKIEADARTGRWRQKVE